MRPQRTPTLVFRPTEELHDDDSSERFGGTVQVSPRKIVILASFRIFPAESGGQLRTAVVAKALARLGHEVRVYSIAGRREDYRERGAARFGVAQIEPNLSEEIHLGLGYGLAQAATRHLRIPRAWVLAMLGGGHVPQRLRAALEWADICISDMPWCVPVPPLAQRKPWLLLSHNLEHRLLEQSHWRERAFAPWLKRVEASVPGRYRGVLTCAEDDRAFYAAHDPQSKCPLIPVGCAVDSLDYRFPPGMRERQRGELGVADDETLFVFSGSSFQPNVDALCWLRKFNAEHAAFLAEQRVRFLVVGTVAPSPWREAAIIATGRVPLVLPYFAAADAGLNPVCWGSGANVKLFEYIAARLPVMSTQFGVRGSSLLADRDFHHFEPEQFRQRLLDWKATQDRAGWRAHAEAVWQRHQGEVDIQQVLGRALNRMPLFSG